MNAALLKTSLTCQKTNMTTTKENGELETLESEREGGPARATVCCSPPRQPERDNIYHLERSTMSQASEGAHSVYSVTNHYSKAVKAKAKGTKSGKADLYKTSVSDGV